MKAKGVTSSGVYLFTVFLLPKDWNMVAGINTNPYFKPESTTNQLSDVSLSAAAAAKSLQQCPTLCDPIAPQAPPRPWDSQGKNTGVGCHFLLQCMKVKSES